MTSAGRLCIFNHQDFESNPSHYRYGSEYDVESLQEVFGKYGVRSKVYNNLRKDQVKKKMEKLADIPYTNKSCLVIAILSHGGLNDTILASGKNDDVKDKESEWYSIQQEIIDPIIANTTLHGKAKIFLIQACKGGLEVKDGHQDQVDSCNLPNIPKSNIKKSPNPDQVYRFYSTSENKCISFVAYRMCSGSRFIQVFCYMLDKYGEEMDIDKIMTLTYIRVKELSNNKQFPSKNCTAGDQQYIFGHHAMKLDETLKC